MRRGAGGVARHHGSARRHHGASRHEDHLSSLEEPSEASSHEAQMQSSASPYRSYEVSSASADFSKLGGSSFGSSTLPRTKSSASVRRGSAGAAVRKREQKKALQAAKKAEEERLRKQLEQWFAEFDTDGNKQLDREELRKLLAHIFHEVRKPLNGVMGHLRLAQASHDAQAEQRTERVDVRALVRRLRSRRHERARCARFAERLRRRERRSGRGRRVRARGARVARGAMDGGEGCDRARERAARGGAGE